jgi:hypothetical protein
MATKKLGADAFKKVQTYSGKSEQAKLTGIDDRKREKSMNLELKEEAKKGGFAKLCFYPLSTNLGSIFHA